MITTTDRFYSVPASTETALTGYNIDRVRKIMDKVCRITNNKSPLCNDRNQLKIIDKIATEHHIWLDTLIWVSYAESRIGISFAPKAECSKMNNWWGIKARKNDDWTVNWIKLPYKWCWLYPFESMKEYWSSLANTLSRGYVKWGCDNIRCLSIFYVGKPWNPKDSWINRVNYFILYK